MDGGIKNKILKLLFVILLVVICIYIIIFILNIFKYDISDYILTKFLLSPLSPLLVKRNYNILHSAYIQTYIIFILSIILVIPLHLYLLKYILKMKEGILVKCFKRKTFLVSWIVFTAILWIIIILNIIFTFYIRSPPL